MIILENLILLLYFQFSICMTLSNALAWHAEPSETPSYNESYKGLCVINYTEKEAVSQSYYHTYTKPELQLCSSGYRYYNCWKDATKSEIRTKQVYKDVPKTKVECCTGYETRTVHAHHISCDPICKPACIQGHCSTPGNCTCFQGYEHENSHKCIPICKPGCINGLCTSPGHCECNSGYDKMNSSYCAPHCSQNCRNSICYKPEECLCNTGYKKSSYSQYKCEPICEETCINSSCTAFNECTCWDGYRKLLTSSNACKPFCQLECLHGECTAPDICTCHEGYTLKNNTSNVCKPECYNCTNGYCTEPNKCICFENYTLSHGEEGQCKPNCDDCINGECYSPYTCDCYDGYEKNDDDKCEPYCTDCNNGKCTEPDVCTCNEGYEGPDECTPQCKYGCSGGKCVAPNNCSCQEHDRIEENYCFPLEKNNSTTNKSQDINVQRFQIKISNPSETIEKMDFSEIYIKINCPFQKSYNSSNCETEEFSIRCTPIKNLQDSFTLLCIWNRFNDDILNIYNELTPKVLYKSIENSTILSNEILNMTFLLPADMVGEKESCHMCPCPGQNSSKAETFNISFSPCEIKKLHHTLMTHTNWKGIGLIAMVFLVIITIVTVGSVILYLRKRRSHDYFVHTSSEEHLDEIALPLNPHES